MRKVFSSGGLLLLLASAIWGMAFVAQSAGMEYVRPFTFVCVRFILAGLVLLPFIAFLDKKRSTNRKLFSFTSKELIGGVLCGIVLFSASSFQQFGILGTSAGKSAFITSLYVVLVPVLGLFVRKKVSIRVWFCALLALFGIALLSADFDNAGVFSKGDIFCLCCAIIFSIHIVVIDKYSPFADGVRMSCIQFFTAGLLGLPFMLILEKPCAAQIMDAWLEIGYVAVFSSGVAYTLQIVGQKRCHPVTASIIMSLESVFGAVSGAIILGFVGGDKSELMNLRELIGCAVVLFAVVFAQLPPKSEANNS